MKVIADYARCEGHGLCVQEAPEIFELDDDGELINHFDGGDIPAEHAAVASSAASACPVAALRVE